jgi:hypothetical protein
LASGCRLRPATISFTGYGSPNINPYSNGQLVMSISLNQTGADCDILALENLETVTGGKIIIIGCTTPIPPGGYPPGTITINPWIGGVWRW